MGIATADGGEGMRKLLSMSGTTKTHSLLNSFFSMSTEHKTTGFLQGLFVQADLYRSAMLSFFENYDLVLCPVNALPAAKHRTTMNENALRAFSYTMAFDLTGWPGAVIRCGTSSEGLPLGVQAVARPWRED